MTPEPRTTPLPPELPGAMFDAGDVPLLLLPVRLETRFSATTLQIRVFPDQIHVDAHLPRLSAREQALGAAFWTRRRAGDADGAREDLARRVGARRAAWVARETRPAPGGAGARPVPGPPPSEGTTPATAAALPDRWCAIGVVGGQRVFTAFGKPIRTPLPVAPELGPSPGVPGSPGAPAIDAGAAWMVDFPEALEAGMALTVDVAGIDLGPDGLTLLVAGLRGGEHPEAVLASLLEAHHYTDGLEVLAQGTPTNTTDAAVAGWTAAVDDVAGLFARELDDEGLAPAKGSAAEQLATALGLDDASLLRRVSGAAIDEDAAMAAMNRVLWPVTWGSYLDDLLAPESGRSIVPAAARRAVERFFVAHVRGGAALPVLAVGPQPYGVLPVMVRDGAALTDPDPLVALEGVLLALRERWRDSVPAVARLDPVDRKAGDEVVAEVLGLLPHPGRFVARRLTFQWASRTGVWRFIWDAMALPDSPLLLLAFIRAMTFPTLTSVEEELELLEDLAADPAAFGIPSGSVADARTLLGILTGTCESHLARQLPLNEWYPDAFSGVFDDAVTGDPKLFFSDFGAAVAIGQESPERLVTRPLVAGVGAMPAQYLAAVRARVAGPAAGGAPSGPGVAGGPLGGPGLPGTGPLDGPGLPGSGPLGGDLPGAEQPLLLQLVEAAADLPAGGAPEFAQALDVLAGRPVDELTLRLRETLGLAGHRLDAWLTGLASRELAARRGADENALRLGGFGWVERLLPDAAGSRDSQGFIHAPSLGHAATAAVLRAGFTAHGSDDPASLMAVDLRSDRVRTAAYLLDGLRRGGDLGDLLGCRFERRLHDAGLDRFIDDCRRRVLEARGVTRDPRGPVDGLELAALYASGGIEIDPSDAEPFVVSPAHRETAGPRAGLQAALEDVLGAMDAVGDAAIADAVHHVLEGNAPRASATLEGLATGAVAPPELSGLDTPRPGAGVAHRLVVLLRDGASPGAGWASSPLARLEPGLAAWAATLLGSPARVRCAVAVTGEGLVVRLSDVVTAQRLSALDLVFERPATWAARVRAHMLSTSAAAAEHEDDLEVDLAPEGLGPGEVSFADLAQLAAAVRSLLASARPLDAPDLGLPGAADPVAPGADPAEAEGRLTGHRRVLRTAVAALARLLPVATDADPRPVGDAGLASLRAALGTLGSLGIESAVPVHGYAEPGRAAAFDAAWTALADAQARLDADAAVPPAAGGSAARRVRQRAEALLGRGFPILPRFAAPAPELGAALARSDALLAGDAARAVGWLRTVAHVREGARRLEEVVTLGELLDDRTTVRPVVGQLPVVDGEPWVALHAPLDRRQGRLALWVLDAGGRALAAAGRPLAGLVVDEWTDEVPAPDVVTGVAVHHDAPSSRPPQALLLALPPAGRTWSLDAVADTLLDTLEAARLRAVDPDILAGYGHQMPAILVPGGITAGPQPEAVGG